MTKAGTIPERGEWEDFAQFREITKDKIYLKVLDKEINANTFWLNQYKENLKYGKVKDAPETLASIRMLNEMLRNLKKERAAYPNSTNNLKAPSNN